MQLPRYPRCTIPTITMASFNFNRAYNDIVILQPGLSSIINCFERLLQLYRDTNGLDKNCFCMHVMNNKTFTID